MKFLTDERGLLPFLELLFRCLIHFRKYNVEDLADNIVSIIEKVKFYLLHIQVQVLPAPHSGTSSTCPTFRYKFYLLHIQVQVLPAPHSGTSSTCSTFRYKFYLLHIQVQVLPAPHSGTSSTCSTFRYKFYLLHIQVQVLPTRPH